MSLEGITRREFLRQSAYFFGGSAVFNHSEFFTESDIQKKFKNKISNLNWVSYAPTNFNPDWGVFPSEKSIRKDLRKLNKFGFNGIITYGSDGSLYLVPKIARGEGFKGVIMGIWSPSSQLEKRNARKQKKYVDGYIIGNEGLFVRYNLYKLKNVIKQIKRATGKPVTTTQQIEYYYNLGDILMELGDWLCPNAHPYWHGLTDPVSAANWTAQEYSLLRQTANISGQKKKPILFKEVGLPSSGNPSCNEKNQKRYYARLMNHEANIKFSVFEAFDQYWKSWAPVEPHWGIFTKDRKRKPVANYFKRVSTRTEKSVF